MHAGRSSAHLQNLPKTRPKAPSARPHAAPRRPRRCPDHPGSAALPGGPPPPPTPFPQRRLGALLRAPKRTPAVARARGDAHIFDKRGLERAADLQLGRRIDLGELALQRVVAGGRHARALLRVRPLLAGGSTPPPLAAAERSLAAQVARGAPRRRRLAARGRRVGQWRPPTGSHLHEGRVSAPSAGYALLPVAPGRAHFAREGQVAARCGARSCARCGPLMGEMAAIPVRTEHLRTCARSCGPPRARECSRRAVSALWARTHLGVAQPSLRGCAERQRLVLSPGGGVLRRDGSGPA